jgi:hypothetical protein
MTTRSGGLGLGGGRAGGGGGGGGGGARRAPGGDNEEERRRIRSVAAKKRASRRWTNWGRTLPPSLAPYTVSARTAPARAREPVLRLSPPPVTWDVGEASSSASAAHPIIDRRRGDLEEEAELAVALAESTAMAAAKKRREEEETAAAIATIELFKQQEELEARAWVEGDDEVAPGEGDAEAEVIVVDSD